MFTGDEMVSGSYETSTLYNEACLEVKAKYVSEESKGSDGSTTVNLVNEFGLTELQQMTKKELKAAVKEYRQRVA